MIIFKFFGKWLGKLFRAMGYLGKFGGILPVGIFVVTDFFINWFKANLPYAFSQTAKSVFSAELVINEKVHQAIANAQGYNLIDLIQIIISLYILYALVMFITRLQIGISGAQAKYGAVFLAIIVVAIIEISAIKLIDGNFGFIPLWNGIIFLFMNIGPVFTSVFGVAATSPVVENIVNSSINGTNSTLLGISILFRKKDI